MPPASILVLVAPSQGQNAGSNPAGATHPVVLSAGGAALDGVLIAFGGYRAVGLGLAWRPTARSGSGPLPT